jgi:hypothetical protein
MLQVLSKGTIAYQKDYQITETTYKFDVIMTTAMAPSAKFIVTYIGGQDRSAEVLADYLELAIAGSMQNSVSIFLEFIRLCTASCHIAIVTMSLW